MEITAFFPFSYNFSDLSLNQQMENSEMNHGKYFDSCEDSIKTLGAPYMEETCVMDVGLSSQSASHISRLCEFPCILYESDDQFSVMLYCTSTEELYV